MGPQALVAVWTWITFGVVAFVLYKIAWKPILAALDAREDRIRQSVGEADRLRAELAALDDKRRAMLAEVETRTQQLIAEARAGAAHAAENVERRSVEKVKILYENAERDITAMKRAALAEIRTEQLNLILGVAGRLVAADMDTEKNRALTDKLLAELK
jgi:F-type H+-transporting ATPase subunit b